MALGLTRSGPPQKAPMVERYYYPDERGPRIYAHEARLISYATGST